MRSGDLVKEKKRLLRDGEVARIGVIVRDDMSGLITVLWTCREPDLSSQTLIMSM